MLTSSACYTARILALTLHSFPVCCRSTSCWISVQETTAPVPRRSRRNSIPSTKSCACIVVKSSSSSINISARGSICVYYPLLFKLLHFWESPADCSSSSQSLKCSLYHLQESPLRRTRKIRTLRLKAAFWLCSTKSKALLRKQKRSQRRNKPPPVSPKKLHILVNAATVETLLKLCLVEVSSTLVVKLLFVTERHEEGVEFDCGLHLLVTSSEAVNHPPVVSVCFC